VKQIHDVVLDLLALSAEQLAGTLLFQTFERNRIRPVYEFVDGLNEFLVQLLNLEFLL
jgi:hypothetical protein